jgi:hypothetical protein
VNLPLLYRYYYLFPTLSKLRRSVMDGELVTKRLHISGLTPAITAADISRRLSTFGTVKDLDGFGNFDGLGQPRKFGYVTLEGSKIQLAKCEYFHLLCGGVY